jgi:3-mercaptopyruvate sulfurtransferase SseA
MGFTNIAVLDGGFPAWKEGGSLLKIQSLIQENKAILRASIKKN